MDEAGGPQETAGGGARRLAGWGCGCTSLGAAGGALAGALVVGLLMGWDDDTRSLGSDRPAGIVGGSGTEAGFTGALTLISAFYGAVAGAGVGLLVGLFIALRGPRLSTWRPDSGVMR